jgi:DNA-binding XRE family transcriptional regulator
MTELRVRSTLGSLIDEMERDREIAAREAEAKPSRDLAILLAGVRKTLGLNQREFALLTGVSPAYISKLESGNGNPSIRSLSTLLRKAGVALTLQAKVVAPASTSSARGVSAMQRGSTRARAS